MKRRGPALPVSRAETRLTVYRPPYIDTFCHFDVNLEEIELSSTPKLHDIKFQISYALRVEHIAYENRNLVNFLVQG